MRRYAALGAVAGLVPMAVLLLFFVVPVAGMLRLGFLHEGRLDLAGVGAALLRPRVGEVVWFTLWSSALATAVTVALGVPTAYALHRLALPGRRLLRALVAAPFVLPTVVVGVAFRSLLSTSGPLGGLGLDGTPAAIVAALVFFNVSVVVRTVFARRSAPIGSLTPRLHVWFVRTRVTAQLSSTRHSAWSRTGTPARRARRREMGAHRHNYFPTGGCYAIDQAAHARQTARETSHATGLREQRDAVCVRAVPRRIDRVRAQSGDRHNARS